MERNRAKSKGSKNGLQGIQKAVERSTVREATTPRLLEILQPLGLEVHLRGTRKQVKKLEEIEEMLSQGQIHHIRKDYRPDAISLFVTVPGQRWEVDVMADGEVEWECFRSDGEILDEEGLVKFVREFGEPE